MTAVASPGPKATWGVVEFVGGPEEVVVLKIADMEDGDIPVAVVTNGGVEVLGVWAETLVEEVSIGSILLSPRSSARSSGPGYIGEIWKSGRKNERGRG